MKINILYYFSVIKDLTINYILQFFFKIFNLILLISFYITQDNHEINPQKIEVQQTVDTICSFLLFKIVTSPRIYILTGHWRYVYKS